MNAGPALTWMLRAVLAAGMASFPALAAACWWTPPFPGKAFQAAFFALAGLEKLWSQCLRQRDAAPWAPAGRDWTAPAVGAAYVLMTFAALAERFWRRGPFHPVMAGLGLGLYLAALVLQYAAFAHLRRQWAVHLDRPRSDRCLVTSGPYRALRHPLYAAYLLEALAIPLVLHAAGALVFALLVFLPLELARIRVEERLLRATFGRAYEDYAARTGAFWPRRA